MSPRTIMSTKVPTTEMIELESLFGPLFDEYFDGVNQVVSKSSAVTTADASDKRQQQPDSTLSASNLETTVISDGNFDLDCIQQISKGKQFGFYNKRFLSKEDLKGTHIEHGFKRAFMSLFGQYANTFTSTMLLNVDQLQKQIDKDEFQKDESMAAFWVVNNQFQKFIDSQFTLDYDSQMTYKYFIEYTGIDVKHFKDTPLQHMSNVKKFVAERTRHPRQYDRRLNKWQLHTQENKIDTGEAVDDALVVT
ncbi:hypothetical protein Tco_0991222 [Tanacetum coccineum]|uniref:Uncharacterized protein n=1 Tax=Tanacetum coccineum TaxID=301880 RepID=A0ABQ5EZF5_9ASTR